MMIDFVTKYTWPWYVVGPLIATVMVALLYSGNQLGISSNLRTMCSIMGGGKKCDLFNFNWKLEIWNLVFAAGLIVGGYLAHISSSDVSSLTLSPETIKELSDYGLMSSDHLFVPQELFSWRALLTLRGFILMVVGGFFVGFGTRYAGGCTSGHAISGLSSLQPSSLVAVAGFFIGGLLMTHLIFPFLLAL